MTTLKNTLCIISLFLMTFFLSTCKKEKDKSLYLSHIDEFLYLDKTQPTEVRVADLLKRLTLAEKIGQMTQVARDYLVSESDISDYYLGSLLSGGGSGPSVNLASNWATMIDGYQQTALAHRIPLIYGIDALHGNNNVYGAVIFPHNIGMGCTRNMQLIESAARATSEEMLATGIPWTFAPCVAVARNIHWGRTYESYSENPELVSQCGAAAVKGLQQDNIGNPTSVIACAKHFFGDGGTTNGVNEGNTELTESQLRAIHLPGYISAIQAGVATVMVSYSSWNGTKMHANKYLITDLLKGELGFKGFVVSDWDGIKKINTDYTLSIEQAINAGVDMAMVTDSYKFYISTLTDLVNKGKVPMSRIDDAVSRILKVKFDKGLFETPYSSSSLSSSFGGSAHREIARECVRQSIVLLKNESSELPLSKNTPKIKICGKMASNLGAQCGGWTITWQGNHGNITNGTTILQAIKDKVSSSTTIQYDTLGNSAQQADVAVIVVGEKPYAETGGDSLSLSLSAEDAFIINNVSKTGIPIVLVVISGRPLIITEIIPNCSAVVAAWLPGTEGSGVADVLFGDYNPTGKLSRIWPRDLSQVDKCNDNVVDPLFNYGFGLKY